MGKTWKVTKLFKFSKSSSNTIWWPQIKRYPLQYSLVLACIVAGLVPALLLVMLVTYALRQLQNPPALLPWMDLLGEHASRWARPYLRGTIFEQGIPIEIQVEWFPTLLAGTALAAAFFKFAQEYLLEDMGEKIARDVRLQVMKTFTSMSFESASRVEPGLLASLVGEDTREVRQTFTRLLGSVVADGLTTCLFVTWLALLDTQLFVLFIAVLLPAGIVIRITGRTLRKLSRLGLGSQSELVGSLLEKMRGWQSIQVHRGIRFELAKFNATNSSLFNSWRRAARAKALGTPLVEWLATVAASFIIVVALRRIAEDALSSSVLTDFLVTIAMLSNSIQSLITQLNSSKKGAVALQRIQEFSGKAEISSLSQPVLVEKLLIESISLKGASLQEQNSEKTLLTGLDLELKKGEFCIIVGPSGIGKSTLLRVLLGLTNLRSGEIAINGLAPTPSRYAAWAQDIAFVPQEPFIFEGTLFDNIVYPESILEPTLLDCRKAELALTNAHLEKNLFSSVTGLSGGERQRLMFARAFFRDAGVWIIDEGTSALDADNERRVLEAIKLESENKIILTVAHRLSIRDFGTHVLDLKKFTPLEI